MGSVVRGGFAGKEKGVVQKIQNKKKVGEAKLCLLCWLDLIETNMYQL